VAFDDKITVVAITEKGKSSNEESRERFEKRSE
jgi:hypothetical protein